jgi:hypothetical protein
MTATQPLHLVRLDVANFLRVEALTIDAQGKHVIISGRNTPRRAFFDGLALPYQYLYNEKTMKVTIPKLTCKRCGHSWSPRRAEVRKCPKCNSSWWDKEKSGKR